MNLFSNQEVAKKYDQYYQTGLGKSVDKIEKALIRKFLDQLPFREMLELGCGTGHWTEFFCDEGFHVTAIDESEAMLEQAGTKNIANAGFLKADAAHLPFLDQHFSLISSVTMFEFVEDVNHVLDEIDRVLKPGGYLLAGWLNAFSEIAKNKDKDEIFKHARFYTPAEIVQLMRRFGEPQLGYGVYYSSCFDLLDGTDEQNSVQAAFIASFVQKN